MMSRHNNLTGPSIASNRANRRASAPLFKFDGVSFCDVLRLLEFLMRN